MRLEYKPWILTKRGGKLGLRSVVICPEPVCGFSLSLFDGLKAVLIQLFLPDCSVIALDIGILSRLSWLDMADLDPFRFSP